ncbi:hypothetical protein [Piscirickettsia salmonis]|uniref:Uncharacterized protein n=1 Tax=Piscirickettsia salmonis TaxID=1238 RepID=A0A9Q6LUZ1_PISSA|nr:hypothetical protein [Piscirickettsia salmonis]ALA24553.1 quinol oxidase subunit 2 [Piscirickettsia salmonis]ERL62835.1 hypothetical protein K661_00782 [Piscirickettsia salmonis LF-89 = ATCC VR-1361]QGN77796.1 hypothetical protein Psal001_02015 [Piscirickettsia salmonis]QGN81384.1 hypothetical protein Psal002_02038 [Piscirickettsia salmonis]QGN84344.1 hypothetical protein Psal003_01394 [Piscirickettsia salmonis]
MKKNVILLIVMAALLLLFSVISFAAEYSLCQSQSVDDPQNYATQQQYQWMNERGSFYR